VKILVVDDEPTIREIARELLTSAGYNVLIAKDGRQALALARTEQPVLVVLDLVMPGMSGIDVLREIRNDPQLKETLILIVTGINPEEEVRSTLREYGVDEILSKKEFMNSFVSRVQEILSKQAHQAA
jgi:two-component system alkaline phosphatase synthesis response regulator PhoP